MYNPVLGWQRQWLLRACWSASLAEIKISRFSGRDPASENKGTTKRGLLGHPGNLSLIIRTRVKVEDLTPQSCPLTSTPMPWHMYPLPVLKKNKWGAERQNKATKFMYINQIRIQTVLPIYEFCVFRQKGLLPLLILCVCEPWESVLSTPWDPASKLGPAGLTADAFTC